MYAYEVLKRFQFGVETENGVAVTAPLLTGGTLTLNGDYAEVDVYRAGYGSRFPVVNTAHVKRYKVDGLRADIPPAPSIIAYLLLAAINGAPTVAEITTGGGDYRHTFTPSTSIKSLTGEAGTNAAVYRLPYMLINGFTLSGNAAEGSVSMNVDLQAQKREPIPDFTEPELRPNVFLNGALVTLKVGETSITGIVDWELSYKTGLHGKRVGGSLYYTAHGFGAAEVTLSLGLERTPEVAALETSYLNHEPLQIIFEVDSGVAIGETATTEKFAISAPAIITEFQPFGKTNEENAIESVNFLLGAGFEDSDVLSVEVYTNHA